MCLLLQRLLLLITSHYPMFLFCPFIDNHVTLLYEILLFGSNSVLVIEVNLKLRVINESTINAFLMIVVRDKQ